MSTPVIALVMFGAMIVMLACGIWIALALCLTAWIGVVFFTGASGAATLFVSIWCSTASWELASLPLFIWMGEILFRRGSRTKCSTVSRRG